MAKYISTTDDMLANAYNNWRMEHVKDKLTVAPNSTVEKYREMYASIEREGGFRTISLDCITAAELKVAMEWYKANTDWSAFKKSHWEAAYATLQ